MSTLSFHSNIASAMFLHAREAVLRIKQIYWGITERFYPEMTSEQDDRYASEMAEINASVLQLPSGTCSWTSDWSVALGGEFETQSAVYRLDDGCYRPGFWYCQPYGEPTFIGDDAEPMFDLATAIARARQLECSEHCDASRP